MLAAGRSRPLGLHLLRQIDRPARADVVEMAVEEAACSAATPITKHFEKIVVGIELALPIERVDGILERDPVHVNAAVLARSDAARQSPLVDQPGNELDRAQFAHERELNVISFKRPTISRFAVGVAWRSSGLICTSSTSFVVVVLNSGKIDGLPR